MFVPRRTLGMSSPFSFFGNGPFFDEDPDKGGGGAGKESSQKEEKPKPKTKEVPLDAVVFASQDDVDRMVTERVNRASEAARTRAEEDLNREQGDYKKIVEEQFNPLKTKVEKELEPELEKWRTLATAEISTLKASLTDELKELMPANMSLTDQLDWLRKAAKTVKSKTGHSPQDPDPKGSGTTARLEELKKKMGLTADYRT